MQTNVGYMNFIIGKNEQYFPKPEEFDPQRWTRELDKPNPFALLPFGFGPRACYGE